MKINLLMFVYSKNQEMLFSFIISGKQFLQSNMWDVEQLNCRKDEAFVFGRKNSSCTLTFILTHDTVPTQTSPRHRHILFYGPVRCRPACCVFTCVSIYITVPRQRLSASATIREEAASTLTLLDFVSFHSANAIMFLFYLVEKKYIV